MRDLAPSFLVVDGDLTGLVVSDQAETYEGADWGYMGETGGAAKGYQFARVQVQGRQGPLVLGGFLHSGRTVSVRCLAELIGQVEATLGRPRRRVELIAQRLAQVEQELASVEQALAHGATGRRQECLRQRQERLRAEVTALRQRREEMEAENARNLHPRRIILRLDGSFEDAPQLAWLCEQGYDFVVRAHNHHVAQRCRAEEELCAAQNLLRYFQWQVLRRSSLATTSIKDLVRRAANSRALVQARGRACVLHFAADSSWPDHTLVLPTDLTYQLCLPELDLAPLGAPAP